MKTLFNDIEFNSAKSTDKLPCECYNCNNTFYVIKKLIAQELKYNRGRIKFCDKLCYDNYQKNSITKICANCNTLIQKKPSELKLSKSGNYFCSKSCAVSYNNTHKTKGIRRSKLEIWIENQLTNIYPDLDIIYNNKNIINSELDIYIPSLKLAFELNGIFHYEPIYGEDKLNQIQNNDNNKFKNCQINNISLCVIDTSQQKYFKEKSSKKYLDIITTIINNSMNMLNS